LVNPLRPRTDAGNNWKIYLIFTCEVPTLLANGGKLLKRLFVNCFVGGLSHWQSRTYFIHYAYRRWELINSDSVAGSALNPLRPIAASIIQAARYGGSGRRKMAAGKMAALPLKEAMGIFG